MRIDSRLETRENNFDLLRLLAALLVIMSHSYPMVGANEREFFVTRLGGYDTGGGIAVAIFFVISGFLVTRSVQKREISNYVRSRFLRIVPGLFILTAVEILVLGAFFSTVSLTEYFTSSQTWKYFWNFTIFDIQTKLPGVFEANPYPGINPSLWTIPVEVFCYMLLPICLVVGLLEKHLWLILTLIIAAIYVYVVSFLGLHWGNPGWLIVRSVFTFVLLKFGLFFLVGGLIWFWRERIPLDPGLALIALALLVIGASGSWNYAIYHITLPYLVIFFAFYKKVSIPFYERIGDISYGTYLYGSPTQQAVVAVLGSQISPTKLTLISVPIVIVLGFLSWTLVEKPFLRIKK